MGLLIAACLATPVFAADDAEFAINLLSDIAPVLALFGDQFAKQFTSESLTWVDHLIFAMVPLGIITAITGAIRIQGTPMARAFIGRARENRAQAEIELMSSTSEEVCEMFNGNSIVRSIGKPQIAQFLIFPHQYERCEEKWKAYDNMLDDKPPRDDLDVVSCGIHSLRMAQEHGHIVCMEYRGQGTQFIQGYILSLKERLWNLYKGHRCPSNTSNRASSKNLQDPETAIGRAKTDSEATDSGMSQEGNSVKAQALPPGADRVFRSPPNIQLNHTSEHFDSSWVRKHHEIFLAAIAGVLIQTGLIVIAGTVAFRISPNATDLFESKAYGFPCYAAGSLLLSVGVGICSFIVERSTDEYSWMAVVDNTPATENNAPRLLWLQNKQSVSDQVFNGYVIAAGPKKRIVTSSRNDNPERHRRSNKSKDSGSELLWEWLAIAAALSAALGFISQFMGLRGLAFPCSLAHLGAIFVMALIRATIRRRLGEPMEHCNAFQWYEIDFLATRIVSNKGPRSSYWVSRGDEKEADPKECFKWSIATPDRDPHNSRHFVRLAIIRDCSSTVNGWRPASSTSSEGLFEDISPEAASPEDVPTENNSSDDPVAGTNVLLTPTSQQLLRVRKRLGDLSRWRTRSSAAALALVQSIELFMKEFFTSSRYVGYRERKVLKSLNWLVEGGFSTESGNHDVIHFVIAAPKSKRGLNSSKFEINSGLIDAAMSLWMAHIDAKKPQNIDDDDKTNQRSGDWRREKAGDSLNYDFYRIIGNNTEDGSLKRDISWWVDDATAELSARDMGEDKSKVDIVIGFNGIEQDSEGNGDDDAVHINELGISSKESLPTILAQHLFTAFMWTVAQYLPDDCLQPMDDDGEKEIGARRGPAFDDVRLKHQRLDYLVGEMEDYGLGNRNQIILCMIPALSSRKLLPNQVALKLIPRMSPTSRWVNIASVHQISLERIEAIDIGDVFNVGIVTATMDFLSFVYDNYDDLNEPLQELDDTLTDIVQQLSTTRFSDLLKNLAPVYTKQHRLELFRCIFRRFGDQDPIGHVDQKDLEKPSDERFARKTLGFTDYHLWTCWPRAYAGMDGLDSLYDLPARAKYTVVKDLFGWTPYHYGCLNEKIAFLDPFVQSTEKSRQVCRLRCNLLRSPLDIICLEGKAIEIKRLLDGLSAADKKDAVQGCGIDGMTPVHLIAKSGSQSAAQSLASQIDLSTFLTKEDFWGRQALHVASKLGHEAVAVMLLELGARSDSLDESGKSPVDYYLNWLKGKWDESILRNNTADSSCSDIHANESQREETGLEGIGAERSRMFLNFFMKDPDCRYSHGRTFLHFAVQVANESSIHTLLQRGFLIDAKDKGGRTPLFYAILAGRAELSIKFIKGFDVVVDGQLQSFHSNVLLKDHRNITPLMLAAEQGLQSISEVLLHNMDPKTIDEIDDYDKTALFHAKDLSTVKFLVESGASPLRRDKNGRTRLHLALVQGHKEIATFLLCLRGPHNLQQDSYDNEGNSLLTTASKIGLAEVIPAIVTNWQDIIEKKDKNSGYTPLGWATRCGRKAVAEILIDYGANVNTQVYGQPLLSCSATGQDFEMLNLFVEKDLIKHPEQCQESPLTEDDDMLKLEERDIYSQTPLEICIDMNLKTEACGKAIRNLLLHYRLSSSERLRCLKMMVKKKSPDLEPIFADGFRKIVAEGWTEKLLLWLVGDRRSIEMGQEQISEAEEDRNQGVCALTLLRPLIEALSPGQLSPENPFALAVALCNQEILQITESGAIDEQGRDMDGWSCATYIQRYDSHGALDDVVAHLRSKLQSEPLGNEPSFLDWNGYSLGHWGKLKVIPCFSNNAQMHGEVLEITAEKISYLATTHQDDIIDDDLGLGSDLHHSASIRSRYCIPPSAKQFYFEMEILDNLDFGMVAIGFCGFTHIGNRLPGLFEKSWGYFGNNGLLIVDGRSGRDYHETLDSSGTYTQGDTVGVYLDTTTGEGFRTKNGKKLETGNVRYEWQEDWGVEKWEEKFKVGKMYPCIGFKFGLDDQRLSFRLNLTGKGDYPYKYELPELL